MSLSEFEENNLNALFALVEKAVKALLPQHAQNIKKDTEGPSVLLCNISIDPEILGLMEEKEVVSWTVRTWQVHYGSRWEPDDYEDAVVGVVRTLEEASALAVNTLFKLSADNFWQAEGEAKRYEEWQKDEALAKEYWDNPS